MSTFLLLTVPFAVMIALVIVVLRLDWLVETGRLQPVPLLHRRANHPTPAAAPLCSCLTPMEANVGEVWECPHGIRWRAYPENLEGYIFLDWYRLPRRAA